LRFVSSVLEKNCRSTRAVQSTLLEYGSLIRTVSDRLTTIATNASSTLSYRRIRKGFEMKSIINLGARFLLLLRCVIRVNRHKAIKASQFALKEYCLNFCISRRETFNKLLGLPLLTAFPHRQGNKLLYLANLHSSSATSALSRN
jgi:hypothetical protein